MLGMFFRSPDVRFASPAKNLFSAGGAEGFLCRLSGEPQKFPGDCFDMENERLRILCEGCALNSATLAAERGGSLFDVLADAYLQGAETIPELLRGAYCVTVFDKREGTVSVINDLFSKRQMFWWAQGGSLCWSTSFVELCGILRAAGVALTVDRTAIGMMIKHKYMFEDYTYAREIRYLNAFRLLTCGEAGTAVRELAMPVCGQEVPASEACARMDELFMTATRLQFAKNAENGYRQVASLSGGMDSKSTFLCGVRTGYTIDRCFTYAESGSLDETIPQRIAADYGCVHLFRAIDRGGFMTDRENMIAGGEGLIYYAGTTGLYGVASSMRTDDVGIVHAGIGGGEIMGDINTVIRTPEEHRRRFEGFVAALGLDKEDADRLLGELTARYTDYNTFCNVSDLRQCINFVRTSQAFFVAMSPFLDEAFFRYLLTLPASMKPERSLYRAWCSEYMSNPYMCTSQFITSKEKKNRGVRLRRLRYRAVRKLGAITGRKTRLDMNPFTYWVRTNPALTGNLDELLAGDVASLGGLDKGLLDSLKGMYAAGDIAVRLNVLTVTWALRRMVG